MFKFGIESFMLRAVTLSLSYTRIVLDLTVQRGICYASISVHFPNNFVNNFTSRNLCSLAISKHRHNTLFFKSTCCSVSLQSWCTLHQYFPFRMLGDEKAVSASCNVNSVDSAYTANFTTVGTQCNAKFKNEDNICIVVLKKTNSEEEDSDSDSSHDCCSPAELTSENDMNQSLVLEGNCTGNEKRKCEDSEPSKNSKRQKKAKVENMSQNIKRPGFSDDRYNETSYYYENGLRKVYPYNFTFTTYTKGRWVGEKIINVFGKEFRAQPVKEYERCIRAGTVTVNGEKVDTDYVLKHNDLLCNVIHRHEVPVTCDPINIVYIDKDIVVVDKPASIPVHPCGRYRHNTVVFILAKEYGLKNLCTIHRLDRLTSGLLLFGRTSAKARTLEQQIRNRQVEKEYVCRVEGEFPNEEIVCNEPIEVVSYKIGVCKVSPSGKNCTTTFQKLGFNGKTSVVLCKPHTGRMHQIRVHLQYLGYPIVNDPLYNHTVFGPEKGRGGNIGKTDEDLIEDLIKLHNAENWLGMDGGSELATLQSFSGKIGDDKATRDIPTSDDHTNQGDLLCGTLNTKIEQPCNEPVPTSDAHTNQGDLLCGNMETKRPCNEPVPTSDDHISQGDLLCRTLNTETKQPCNEPFPKSDDHTNEGDLLCGTLNTETKRPCSEPVSTSDDHTNQEDLLCGTLYTETKQPCNEPVPTSDDHTNQGVSLCGTLNTETKQPCNDPVVPPVVHSVTKSSVATQTGQELPDVVFNSAKMTTDPNCLECKVRYRDPKPKELVMFLHAWKYTGLGWSYKTELPNWTRVDWTELD